MHDLVSENPVCVWRAPSFNLVFPSYRLSNFPVIQTFPSYLVSHVHNSVAEEMFLTSLQTLYLSNFTIYPPVLESIRTSKNRSISTVSWARMNLRDYQVSPSIPLLQFGQTEGFHPLFISVNQSFSALFPFTRGRSRPYSLSVDSTSTQCVRVRQEVPH